MQLSDQQRRILYAAHFAADTSVQKVAKQARVPAHRVHYHLKRLKEEQVIRRGTIINLAALGLREYTLFFSLAPEKKGVRPKLLKLFARHAKVVWFAEVGGNYQFALTLAVRRSNEVYSFLQELVKSCGDIFWKKSFSEQLTFTALPKNYLVPKAKRSKAFFQVGDGTDVAVVEIDDTDRKVLAALSSSEVNSHAEMARSCGMARPTFEYRLGKLTEAGVVLGERYYVSARQLGRKAFIILLSTRSAGQQFAGKLHDFCVAEPDIVSYKQYLGTWDYQVLAELEDELAITAIQDALCLQFGRLLADIQIIPVLQQATSMQFMKTEV